MSRVPILEPVFSGDFHVRAVTSDVGSPEITGMKRQGLRCRTALYLLVVSLAAVVPAALIRQMCVVWKADKCSCDPLLSTVPARENEGASQLQVVLMKSGFSEGFGILFFLGTC